MKSGTRSTGEITYIAATIGIAFNAVGTRGSRNSRTASPNWRASERSASGRVSQEVKRIAMFPPEYPTIEPLTTPQLYRLRALRDAIVSAAGDSGHTGTGAAV